MRLLINCSTLSATGVTQVATSFIYECKEFIDNEYHIFLSKTVLKQVDETVFPVNFSFYLFEDHPLYGFKGFKVRKKIKNLVFKIKPDMVFSVFGPSWWTPKVPHLMGFAYPYIVYSNSPYFSKLTIKEKFKIRISKLIHIYFLKRNGNYYVSETNDVADKIIDILKSNKENSYTATNTCSSIYSYNIKGGPSILPEKEAKEFRFLSLCSFTPHKNLEILNEVIPKINEYFPKLKVKFVLTVNSDLYDEKFSSLAKKSILNVGRIEVDKCPQLYRECDALFLPTLLECFSANYPEAMKMKKPIVTSNLSFATEVCGDAALYFDPMDSSDISLKIKNLIENADLRDKLIKNGEIRLGFFLTAKERAQKYLSICNEILKKNQ